MCALYALTSIPQSIGLPTTPGSAGPGAATVVSGAGAAGGGAGGGATSGPALFATGTAQEVFRYVMDRAHDRDEDAIHHYVLTLAYFTDPVRVLSDLIVEHDVAAAAAANQGKPGREVCGCRRSRCCLAVLEDEDDSTSDEASLPGSERAMRIIAFWVTHLWDQFEGSEVLMNLLTHFVQVSLKVRGRGCVRGLRLSVCVCMCVCRASAGASAWWRAWRRCARRPRRCASAWTP